MRRTTFGVAVAATAVIALAGCSGSSSGKAGASTPAPSGSSASPTTATTAAGGGSTANAAALVAGAAHAGASVRSAHISVQTDHGGKGTTMSGSVAYDPTALDITLAAPNGQKIREVLVGKTIYLKLPTALGGKHWAAISLKDLSKASGLDLTSTLSNSGPSQTVSLLRKAGNIKLVGSDSVGGVATKHLAGTVDIGKVFDQLDTTGKKQWSALMTSTGVKNVHIDLWVDGDNVPLKTIETYDSSLGKSTTTMQLSRINSPVTIKAPPKSQVRSLFG